MVGSGLRELQPRTLLPTFFLEAAVTDSICLFYILDVSVAVVESHLLLATSMLVCVVHLCSLGFGKDGSSAGREKEAGQE